MAKFKVEWSIEARLDLLDILNFYVVRNKSAAYSKKLNSKINNSVKLIAKQLLIGVQTGIKTVRISRHGFCFPTCRLAVRLNHSAS